MGLEGKILVLEIEVMTSDSVSVRVLWAVGAVRPMATCDVVKNITVQVGQAPYCKESRKVVKTQSFLKRPLLVGEIG